MKLITCIMLLFVSHTSKAQIELETLFDLRQEELIRINRVKEKIEYKVMFRKNTDIRHFYYSKKGVLDSIMQVGAMWCTPCTQTANGDLDKDWQMKYYTYHDKVATITNTEFNLTSTKKLLDIDLISKKYYQPDFIIDTSNLKSNRPIIKYNNSNNIYSHYYMDSTKNIISMTILSYNENLNITNKVKYGTSRIFAGNTSFNMSEVTYYYYNENRQRIKEITEGLGRERTSTTEYSYHPNGLLNEIRRDGNQFKFEYTFY